MLDAEYGGVRFQGGQNRGDGAAGCFLFVVLPTFEQVPKWWQLAVPDSPAGEKLPRAPGSYYLLPASTRGPYMNIQCVLLHHDNFRDQVHLHTGR